jgi:hypothetical protein
MDTDIACSPQKPAIRRSSVSAERRRYLDIEWLGFLPKAATFLFPSVFIRVHPWLTDLFKPAMNSDGQR